MVHDIESVIVKEIGNVGLEAGYNSLGIQISPKKIDVSVEGKI